jgi:hypothetical protein
MDNSNCWTWADHCTGRPSCRLFRDHAVYCDVTQPCQEERYAHWKRDDPNHKPVP